MTQPEPAHVIIIGLKEVADDVKKLGQSQCDLISRLDIHIAENRLRTAALEESNKEQKHATDTLREELATLKQNSVSRGSMWLGIGTLATVGGVAVGALALFK